ncbi:hypothetical protein C8R43DRAFT_962059 [Mycena crocata]|nr:hypothetical protein C8R43DRAFT_962059 [Mycena crocata]
MSMRQLVGAVGRRTIGSRSRQGNETAPLRSRSQNGSRPVNPSILPPPVSMLYIIQTGTWPSARPVGNGEIPSNSGRLRGFILSWGVFSDYVAWATVPWHATSTRRTKVDASLPAGVNGDMSIKHLRRRLKNIPVWLEYGRPATDPNVYRVVPSQRNSRGISMRFKSRYAALCVSPNHTPPASRRRSAGVDSDTATTRFANGDHQMTQLQPSLVSFPESSLALCTLLPALAPRMVDTTFSGTVFCDFSSKFGLTR